MKKDLSKQDVYKKRFWAKVDKNGPIHNLHGQCYQWVKSTLKGYGQFWLLGECLAHRVSYRLFVGEIPEGMCVLHKCDNPLCVNPNHLFLGTKKSNMEDRDRKGRQARGDRSGARTKPECLARGENCGNAKLTEADVREIRRRYMPRHKLNGQKALAKEFGVKRNQIRVVILRRCWKHVT